MKPGRNRKGITTPWGARNAAFIAARRAHQAGNPKAVQEYLAVMAKVQAPTKHELWKIEH